MKLKGKTGKLGGCCSITQGGASGLIPFPALPPWLHTPPFLSCKGDKGFRGSGFFQQQQIWCSTLIDTPHHHTTICKVIHCFLVEITWCWS